MKLKCSNKLSIYPYDSKDRDRVNAAAVTGIHRFQNHMPGNATVFTSQLKAINLAFDIILDIAKGHFIYYSDYI